ncbi:hypothetical protein S83_012914, partial [Arachis hypogaea]
PTREDVLKNIRNPPGEIIIIVATVSLPWNNVFGGENLPTFLVGAVAAAVSSMAIFCCLLRHNHTQSEAAKKAVLPLALVGVDRPRFCRAFVASASFHFRL